ncbi:hypothetical protein, partial [Bradyrhizobium sp.]|uniref:hypothetical protein n=1 Tax=Bradyrhizobium sp. TaxID=376 RepID=UPI003C780270
RPMSRLTLTAVTGSGSASGMAMAGGFAACGFAADAPSSSLEQTRLSPNPFVSKNALGYWPEKTVFQANALLAFTLD